jgi:hypothetical protein
VGTAPGAFLMTLGLLFWILMILWFVLGMYVNWPTGAAPNWGFVGGNLLLFILLFVLGWAVFGFVVQGPPPRVN